MACRYKLCNVLLHFWPKIAVADPSDRLLYSRVYQLVKHGHYMRPMGNRDYWPCLFSRNVTKQVYVGAEFNLLQYEALDMLSFFMRRHFRAVYLVQRHLPMIVSFKNRRFGHEYVLVVLLEVCGRLWAGICCTNRLTRWS